MSDNDRGRGLYEKYHVERVDGTSGAGGAHERCAYFVLDLEHDPFGGPAFVAYGLAIWGDRPFEDDLIARNQAAYKVWRADGDESHKECVYFVLDLDHDKFAPAALTEYASKCREEYPLLAYDLDAVVKRLTEARR